MKRMFWSTVVALGALITTAHGQDVEPPPDPTLVPEPTSMVVWGAIALGAGALLCVKRRKK